MTDPAAPPPPPWTAPPAPGAAYGAPVFPDAPQQPDPAALERTTQLRAAGLIVAVLAVLGAVLGVVWQTWSPPGPAGLRVAGSVQADETESFVAGDGRFVLMGAVVGLLAGLAAWYVPRLRAARGPIVALGLAVGGMAGSALMELVGWALRGDGRNYSCGDGTVTCVDHIPLTVHMHALLLIESVVALLVYVLFTAFAAADDLGRPDPSARRVPVAAAPVPPGSVGPQGDLQHGRQYGDGSGAPQ